MIRAESLVEAPDSAYHGALGFGSACGAPQTCGITSLVSSSPYGASSLRTVPAPLGHLPG
jgi:hypothetical protein